MADAFDALVHPRVYQQAYSVGQARRMISSGACGAFDPQMMEAFNRDISGIAYAVYCGSI